MQGFGLGGQPQYAPPQYGAPVGAVGLGDAAAIAAAGAAQPGMGADPAQLQQLVQLLGAKMLPKQTAVVECPKSMVGRVIGKGGETIKSLQQYTGAMIQVRCRVCCCLRVWVDVAVAGPAGWLMPTGRGRGRGPAAAAAAAICNVCRALPCFLSFAHLFSPCPTPRRPLFPAQIDQSTDPTRVTIAGSPQSLQLAVSMVNDIVRGTFKGFAMLRQIALATSQPGMPGYGQPQPVYVQGYGFVPPSQVYNPDDPLGAAAAGIVPPGMGGAAAGMLRSSPPTGPLTPPMTPLRGVAPAGGPAGGQPGLSPELAALLGQQQQQAGMGMGGPSGGSQGAHSCCLCWRFGSWAWGPAAAAAPPGRLGCTTSLPTLQLSHPTLASPLPTPSALQTRCSPSCCSRWLRASRWARRRLSSSTRSWRRCSRRAWPSPAPASPRLPTTRPPSRRCWRRRACWAAARAWPA